CSPDDDLIWILIAHGLVEIAQIRTAPVTSVRRPSRLSGADPRVVAIEICCVSARQILIDEKGYWIPGIYQGAHLIPIGMAAFRKYKDYRTAVVSQVGFTPRRLR